MSDKCPPTMEEQRVANPRPSFWSLVTRHLSLRGGMPGTWRRRSAFFIAVVFCIAIVAIAVSPRLRQKLFGNRNTAPVAKAARVPTAFFFDVDINAWPAGPYTFAPLEFTFHPDKIKTP